MIDNTDLLYPHSYGAEDQITVSDDEDEEEDDEPTGEDFDSEDDD